MFCLYTYLKITLFLFINMTDKEWICSATKNLHQDQYLELLKIITLTNTKYTENNNGIFVDLDKTDDICIKKIINYLKYSQENTVCTNNTPSNYVPSDTEIPKTTQRRSKKILTAGITPDELDYQEDSDIDNLSLSSCLITQSEPGSDPRLFQELDTDNDGLGDDHHDSYANEGSDDES